ncbi:MAG: PrsW family intramembrane metalloprotease [Actinobacteria bacterium]|nr:PrsW family intramembrane metalloprotease [Actinomycetota bacterium]
MRRFLTGLSRDTWWKVLLTGGLAWAGGIAATAYTRDGILLPGVFLLGSFLVPFALLVGLIEYVTRLWLADDDATALVPFQLLLAFAAGGALGLWPAALVEHFLTRLIPDGYFLSVALAEETVKLAIVILLAVGLTSYRRRDGLLLGAAVGLGFSAFESAGYAYEAVRSQSAIDIPAIVEVQLSRGLLSPVGHALWTALVAGALFAAASSTGRLRPTWSVCGWLGVAVLLHAGWDVSAGLAAALVATGYRESLTLAEFRRGVVPAPTATESALLGTVRTFLLAINAALGLVLVRWQWQRPGDTAG